MNHGGKQNVPSHATTVVLVDDSDLACETVKSTLGLAGYIVHALISPFGFINALRQHRPRIILLDIGLGAVSGTKLVPLARQHAPAEAKVLLYSGKDEEELRRVTVDSGADGHISKRISGDSLVAVIGKWAQSGR